MQTGRNTKSIGDERLLFKNLDEAAECGDYGGVQSSPSLATGTARHDSWAESYPTFHFIDSKTHHYEPGAGFD